MLDAKSQLSRLVKAVPAGEAVIIAGHGKDQVALVPCTSAAGLKPMGGLVQIWTLFRLINTNRLSFVRPGREGRSN